MRIQSRQPQSIAEQIEYEEHVAERAANLASFAESVGQGDHAQLFWGLARRARVKVILLRAQAWADPT